MKQSQKINTVQAKNRLNELIAQTNKTKDPIVVEKHGKPVAVVLDYETYTKEAAAHRKTGRESLIKDLENFHKIMKKKYPLGTGDSVEILREVRLERAHDLR